VSARWARRRLVTGLAALLLSPVLSVLIAMPGARGDASPLPTVKLTVDPSPLIGETVGFDVSFWNDAPLDTGYGPFVDLTMPMGADGYDGLSFDSATYLGVAVDSKTLTAAERLDHKVCVTHPYAVDTSGAPVQICDLAMGQPLLVGQEYVVLRLPFGSFTPGQPAATVHVTADLSNKADAGTAITIGADSGFQFGATPLADPATDPSIFGPPVTEDITPTIMRITKTYIGPEDETATGPNFPRSYKIEVTIAKDQPVTNLTVTDSLPDTIQYIRISTSSPPSPACTPGGTVSTSTPGGTLSCNFGALKGTGGVDATLVVDFYVPRLGRSGNPVLAADQGTFNTSIDSASATAHWIPVDTNDAPTDVSAGPATHTLTDKSIAIQKSVKKWVPGGGDPGPVGPGDELEWTLSVQVSDYFALDNVMVDDLLGDGSRFETGFTPTLNGVVMNTDNYTVSSVTGSGKTPIRFKVSSQLAARGPSGKMIGGCIALTGTKPPDCSAKRGPTTATIVFRSIVQQRYVDNVTEVVEGDTLINEASAYGDVLDTGTLLPTHSPTAYVIGDGDPYAGDAVAFSQHRGTMASITIDRGKLTKKIYAVNGNIRADDDPTAVHVSPGETITYRLTQTLPTTRTDAFTITDYLPLPIFSAATVTTFDDTADATVPAAGHAKYGPADDFHLLHTVKPTVLGNLTANSVEFTYGDYAANPHGPSTADILFTVTVSTDPFADGLLLTNQAQSSTENSAHAVETADAIVQITLDQPVLTITKGVVGTDNPAGKFAPVTKGPVVFDSTAAPPAVPCTQVDPGFDVSGGPITTTGLTAPTGHPIDSNLTGVDGSDYVRFAVVVQDTGHAAAFAVQIKDTIPDGFVKPAGGYDMCVTDGAGTALNAVNVAGGGAIGGGDALFTTDGIQLVDPTLDGKPVGALAPGLSAAGVANNAGTNLVVISYTLRVSPTVVPHTAITNTASVIDFKNSPTASSHLVPGSPLTDTATVTTALPKATKILDGTDQPTTTGTNVVVGEIVMYKLTLTIPEGTLPGATVVDTLPAGLAFVDCSPITASTGVSSSVVTFGDPCVAGTSGANPTVGGTGQVVTFDLGTVTNADTVNAMDETVVIKYRAVVLNVGSNVRGQTLRNSAVLSWTGDSIAAVTAGDVTVVEPKLTVVKTASASTGDAYDSILYTITVSNPSAGVDPQGASAFGVSLKDLVPAGMSYDGITPFAQTTDLGNPAEITVNSGTLSATWVEFDQGESATFHFSATIDASATPGTIFDNTAALTWTSLPGEHHTLLTKLSSFSDDSTERTGDHADAGGDLNTYSTSRDAKVTVPLATVTKSMTHTNQDFTHDTAVAIGEVVTYKVELTIPEGTEPAATLVDTMPAGLAFVRCTGITPSTTVYLHTTPGGGFGDACRATTNPVVTDFGHTVTFDLGTITNTNNDNGTAETIDITYEAVVLNVGTNASGTQLHNSAVLYWTGDQSFAGSAPDVTVVEPDMHVVKTATPTSGDAGNVIGFTVTITNPNVSNNTNAFEAEWSDAIPVGMTYQGDIACTGTCPASFDDSNPKLLKGSWSEFDMGATATITYTAKLDDTVQSGASFKNTATILWTSLPGDYHTPETKLSSFNDNSTERTGVKTDPGGAANDYEDDANATVNVPQPAPVKTLVSTSEAGTSDTPTPYVAVGEVARFRVSVVIPEGQNPNVTITDTLPAGLSFLNDNTATIAFVTNYSGGGMTSSASGLSGVGLDGLAVSGDGTWSGHPTFTFPSGQISGSLGDGGSPTFNLGTLTNADRDLDTEAVVIEFNVLVDNKDTNVRGHTLTDSARIYIDGTDTAGAAGSFTATVAEPHITFTKTLDTAGSIDGGDTVSYTVTLTNASDVDASPAYDVEFTDTLDSHLTLLTVTPNPLSGSTNLTVGNAIHFRFVVVAPGTSETLTITAKVADDIDAGTTIPNTATGTWTSLPGAKGTTSNPTGSSTPGDPGQPTGERTGDGGVNSYHANSSAPFTSQLPAIHKVAPNVSRPIGATTTFDLVVTLPEGWTRGFTVTDSLPAGLMPDGYAIVVTQADSNGHFGHDFGGTLNPTPTITTPGSGGGAWKFDFGDTYLDPTTAGGNDSFLIRVTVLVANVSANKINDVHANSGLVGYTDPQLHTTVPITASETPTVRVIEPKLQVVKTVDNANPRFGATVKYTLTLSHTGASNSDAYDVTMTDTLPTGLTLMPLSLTYVSGDHTSVNPVINGNTITFTYTTFALTHTSRYTYQATVGNVGSVSLNQRLTNTANSTWTSLAGGDANERTGNTADPGGALNNYRASDPIDVTVSGVDLTLTKDDGRTTATAGATLTYVLHWANVGNATASNVVITETVPIGTTYPGTVWTCAGGKTEGHTCTYAVGSVAGNTSGDVNFAVTVVDPIPPTLTGISNTASIADVGGTFTDPTPDNNHCEDDDTIDMADLSLTKTADDYTPNANQVVEFTLTVSNDGPAQATGVKVTDTLPASLVFAGATPNTGGSYDQSTGVWTVGSVDSGGSQVLKLRATVTSIVPATNVAEVTHSDQRDKDSTPANGVTTEDDYATATVTPKIVNLGVTKVASPIHPDVGANVTYTITATNHSAIDATGVKVTDTLDQGLTYVSSTPSGTTGTYDSTSHVWDIGPLAHGASATLTLVATVNVPGEIGNMATIAGDQFDDDASNNTASTSTDQLLDLSVHKSVDNETPNVGTTVTFTVVVSNAGPGTATGVTISDVLPGGLKFDHATPDGSYDATHGVWTVGTISPLASATLTMYAKVTGPSASTNTASVLHVDEPQSDTTNDSWSATVTPPHADVAVVKTVHESRPSVTDDDYFTIVVTNNGPDTATNVAVTDNPLPDGLTYASAGSSVTQGTFDGAAGTWSVGTLANGATATWTLHVTVTVNRQDFTNTAAVTADQYDPHPENNQSSASLSTRVVDIAVTKVADNPTPTVGKKVTFTVTVGNNGPDGATQLVIHDALPTGLTFDSAATSVGAYDSTSGDWTIGDLADTATVSLAVTAQVVGSGTIDNTAAVSGLLQLDSDHSNDSSKATIEVPPAADLSLSKTVDNSKPDMGSQVTFSVAVTNSGPDATSGVHVADLLPAGITYVSSSATAGVYDPGSGDWNIGGMADGAVETLTITVTVDIEGPITNMAQVTASDLPDPDSTPGNGDPSEDDQSSAPINSHGVADLTLSKTANPSAVRKGDQMTYTIVVTNDGPDIATGVIVRDQLPSGVTYVSSSDPAYNPTTGAWTVGSMADGGSATLTIAARVGQTGSITNTAQVAASDQRDPDPANGEATAVISAGGATPPPTVAVETGLPAGDPGSLALWVLGLALAGFALMSMGPRATRGRRFRLRR
jgi:uncharacterized repeat protein (TIGR01451 family)/fimbrial isopeptide formation D2 family protein